MYRLLLLLISISLLAPAPAQAQDCSNNPANQRNNRCEGYVDLPVSAGFKLVALHGYRQSRYQAGDQLSVAFYQPQAGAARISAQKLRDRSKNYKMEAGQQTWPKGWQVFGPWPVDDFLAPNSIPLRSIGIKVAGTEDLLLPAYVYTGSKPGTTSSSYRAYFETPTSIKVLRYTITREGTEELVYQGMTEDEEAQSVFSLKIPMPTDSPAGVYQLRATITWFSGQKLVKTYSFMHQPEG